MLEGCIAIYCLLKGTGTRFINLNHICAFREPRLLHWVQLLLKKGYVIIRYRAALATGEATGIRSRDVA